MSKFNRRSPFTGRSNGTITVIEAQVHRSSARHAKLGFFVTLFVVGLLTFSVKSEAMHPILALFYALGIGLGCGAVVWALIRIWPVIRLLWWWATEITLSLGVVYGLTALARHTDLMLRVLVLAVVVGVPAVVPAIRRRIIAAAWCLIVRHRLRVCFAQFIVANQSGSLPLILFSRPTPVGERTWLYLRPGLALSDLEGRLDKIAVTCHCSTALIERSSKGKAALVRVDTKRREVLTATVGNPLVDLIDPNTPPAPRDPADVPTALNLSDLPDEPAHMPRSTSGKAANGRPDTTSRKVPAPASASAPSATATAEDVSDWI